MLHTSHIKLQINRMNIPLYDTSEVEIKNYKFDAIDSIEMGLKGPHLARKNKINNILRLALLWCINIK
jgi:hypothetical protein